jgi:1-acyl-sn-glycerol-3-phosphate acyltransferase
VSTSSASPPSPDPAVDEKTPSPLALPAFRRLGERHLARRFHAVRLSRSQRPDVTAVRERPLIVYFNHTSWWDPLICLQLASQLFPGRRHYAPLEQATLRRHRLLARFGFFAIDLESARGARRLLELATRVVEQPEATLWVTAGGILADPRERPVKLQAGLGHLAARTRHAVLLPLALEYPFWGQLLPEALARFGEELAVDDAGMRANDWNEVLAARLGAAQDALAVEAQARDGARFEVIQGTGAATGGGVWEAWRRFREILRTRRRRPLPRIDSGGV